MNRSRTRSNGGALARWAWLRRVHRWVGLVALLFVLLLSVTGIALNHTTVWQLDERYVRWSWLLVAYGIDAPPPAASFADDGHRATLLGRRLYFDDRELARDVDELKGAVATGELAVVATGSVVFILTASGDLVERMDLAETLPAAIAALGLADERVIVRSGDALFRFDDALLNVEPWSGDAAGRVAWSTATPIGEDDLASIQALYRGRGVTVERLLTDLHSGRLFTRFGTLLMDAAAALLILVSLTGLLMWMQRGANGNSKRHDRARR